MRISVLLLALFVLSACRPVHQTKLYYDEYINPVRTVDFDDRIEADFPEADLQHYYAVDRQLVDFVSQLDLVDEEPDASWIARQKEIRSWVKAVAVFDGEMNMVGGDEFLGYDPAVREAVLQKKEGSSNFMVYLDGRIFLVKGYTAVADRERFTVTELDLDRLLPASDVVHVVGVAEHIVGSGVSVASEKLTAIHHSTRYSGSFGENGGDIWWIRSMAASDLVYFYKD